MTNAFKYAMEHAMTTEQNYPYVAETHICNKEAASTGNYRISGYTSITTNNVAAL